MILAFCTTFLSLPLQVKLGCALGEDFTEWNCDSSGDVEIIGSENKMKCIGLCIATAILGTDVITPTSAKFDVAKDPRVSDLHAIIALDPRNGVICALQSTCEELNSEISPFQETI